MAILPPPSTPVDVSRSGPLPRLLLAKLLSSFPFRDKPPPPPSSSSLSSVEVVGIAVGGVIAVVLVLVLLIWLSKKNRRKVLYSRRHFATPVAVPTTYKDSYPEPEIGPQSQESSPPSDAMIKLPLPPPPPPFSITETFGTPTKPKSPPLDPQSLGGPRNWFTYEELKVATDNFAKSNLVGEGGFGCVYKGVLPSGQLVAVKQLNVGGGQGEREFQAEVEIISRVHHRNLVSLVGYCIAENQRLLVYDFVPNCTLDHYLHVKGRPVMNWPTRVRIAVGAARGLAYLHEDCHPRIIHRDIKSSNILLDNNFEAQVSDFGLAKLTTDAGSHVTTRVMGTFGYLAPEYASSGKLTEKSDVFSFGVVLLELVTGRKPVDSSQPSGDESLVEWARPVMERVLDGGDLDLIADSQLNGDYDEKEMMRMVAAAAACVNHSANKRPRMGQVVRTLEDDASLSDLDKGGKPSQILMSDPPYASITHEPSQRITVDMKKLRRMGPSSSQEYAGSENSATTTTEYGMNRSTSSGEYQTSREVDRSNDGGRHRGTSSSDLRKDASVSSSNEYPSHSPEEQEGYFGPAEIVHEQS